jgi:hypothetical protein
MVNSYANGKQKSNGTHLSFNYGVSHLT